MVVGNCEICESDELTLYIIRGENQYMCKKCLKNEIKNRTYKIKKKDILRHSAISLIMEHSTHVGGALDEFVKGIQREFPARKEEMEAIRKENKELVNTLMRELELM